MAKLTLTDISNTETTSLVSVYNNNNSLIEAALENTLSRNGSSPNQMGSNLDLNNNRIINLPTPTSNNEAATKGYADSLVEGLDSTTLADLSDKYDEVVVLHSEAETFRDEAEGFRDEAASFVGAAVSAQTLSTPRVFSFTGDATGTSSAWNGSTDFTVALTIPANSVALSKITNISTATFLGRTTSGSGSPEVLTATQAAALLPTFGSAVSRGVVEKPVSPGTSKFLREDGGWETPPLSTVPTATSYTTTGSVSIGTLILKWGVTTAASTTETLTYVYFAAAFPNSCVGVSVSPWNTGPYTAHDVFPQIFYVDATHFQFLTQKASASIAEPLKISWLAWGY